MKRKTLFALMPLLLLGACTQEDTAEIVGERTYPLNFSVSSLKTDVVPITKSSNSETQLSEHFTTIHYLGYKDYVKIFGGSQIFNAAKPEEFGTITEQVPAGNYYFGFFGVGSGVGAVTLSIGDVMGDNDYIESTGREVWYKEFKNIEVTANTTNMDVAMTRKTGRLMLNITDKAPDNVGKVNVLVYYAKRYRITTGSSSTVTGSGQYSKDLSLTDGTLEPFEFNCFQSAGGMSVKISIYDKTNNILDSRSVSLNVYENRKTIITGELFNNVNGKDFIITVSSDWGQDNIVDL